MNRDGWRRLFGFMRKEWRQMIRDPSSLTVAFLLPALLLFLFGFGVSLDLDRVPVAVIVENPTPETASFYQAMAASPFLDPLSIQDREQAARAMLAGDVRGTVVLRADFARRLRGSDAAPAQVIVNGTDANTARILGGYIQGIWDTWIGQEARRFADLSAPVDLRFRVWFNPAVNSRYFLVPGLIAIIMTLIGALLTALVVAREWERGTMEALLTTPLTRGAFLMGKLAPYFVLGMGGMAVSVALAVLLFGVPFRGSVWVLALTASIFMMAVLGIGLLISTIARNQFLASIVALMSTMLPAVMLSGFLFDIASMPHWVQTLTYAVTARYFVAILQTLFLVGDVWAVIIPNLLALAAMAVFFLTVTWARTRRRLD